MEPDVGRPLPPRGLLGADEPRSHVRLTLNGVGIEVVSAGGAGVDEDRVVLGGPPTPRLAAVVVGPDQLVQEGVAAEDLVQQQLAVVGLAVVDVKVERAVRRQQLTGARNPGREERKVVGERIVVAQGVEQLRAVAPAAEPGAVAVRGVGSDLKRAAGLRAAGVERRIQVDEVECSFRKLSECDQVVPLDDQIVVQGQLVNGCADAHRAAPYRAARSRECARYAVGVS